MLTDWRFACWLVLLAVAGCVEPMAAARLVDHGDCKPMLPDGAPATCRDLSIRVESSAETPPAWLCLDSAGPGPGGLQASVRRDAAGDALALQYVVPDAVAGDVSGFVEVNDVWHAWSDGPYEGFVLIPAAPERGRVKALFYETTMDSETPALAGGTLDEIWLDAAGEPLPVHRVAAESTVVYFQRTVQIEVDDGTTHAMLGGRFEGEDFALDIGYRKFGTALLEYGALPNSATCGR